MELHQVRCFVAVAEELHFGRAAARLHMTQPPLSRQIQLLERALGVLLLQRSERQVRLSAAGQSFLQDARRILKMADLAGQSARRFAHGDSGRLIVGFTAVSGYIMIPQLLRYAGPQLPGVNIELVEQVSSDQVEALEAGLLDIGFLRQVVPNEQLEYNLIDREPFVAAVPSDHALAERERLRPEDFDCQPFLTYSHSKGRYFHDRIASLFARNGVHPSYVHQLGQTHSILGLVNTGQGCALVPASAQALRMKNVVFRPLDRTELRAEMFLAYRRKSDNPSLPFFIDVARRFFSNHFVAYTPDEGGDDGEH